MENLPIESTLVSQIQSSVPQLCETANTCAVWDHDSYNQAADLAKFISEALKTVESERKRITQPQNEALKATNAMFKKLADPLDSALSVIKGKILKYKMDEDRRAREELERQKEEQRAKIAAAALAGQPAIIEAVENLAAIAPVPTTAARGGFGSVSTMKRWTFEVVDISKVPGELMVLDSVKVNAWIKSGIKEIPGLKIFQVETAVVR
ncbi:hypothetical protein EKK58_02185 [Candidatus Dependentiae bacterium]|nr:MAG: hypothetical protein EKK58_02185 [Candidatus Dependentiae bacterium]